MATETETNRVGTRLVCEISNPSDAYTMVAADKTTAVLACLFLGRGQYGLTDRDGNDVCPIFLFGGALEWLNDELRITDLGSAIDQHRGEIADALDSVLIGGFKDRDEIEEATAHMTQAEREVFLLKRHDRRRTSMNDIGASARDLAHRIRKGAKAEGGAS